MLKAETGATMLKTRFDLSKSLVIQTTASQILIVLSVFSHYGLVKTSAHKLDTALCALSNKSWLIAHLGYLDGSSSRIVYSMSGLKSNVAHALFCSILLLTS